MRNSQKSKNTASFWVKPFRVSSVSVACRLSDWRCVVLREIDFPFICWLIQTLHLCEDYLLEYRYDEVLIIAKGWKQCSLGWFHESLRHLKSVRILGKNTLGGKDVSLTITYTVQSTTSWRCLVARFIQSHVTKYQKTWTTWWIRGQVHASASLD